MLRSGGGGVERVGDFMSARRGGGNRVEGEEERVPERLI